MTESSVAALPVLETERLWLRPRVLADLDASIEMDRDPEVTRYIAGPWHDPDEHAASSRTGSRATIRRASATGRSSRRPRQTRSSAGSC